MKYEKNGLEKLTDIPDNDGRLRGYFHQPVNSASGMPLVVVLHGCTQDALEVSKLSDWNMLADRYGFYVLYPEQRRTNNGSKCFNWFNEKDHTLNSGEALSILNMMKIMKTRFSTADSYITGMSAGGVMSMVMLSLYPDEFEGGAIMSGGPFGSAESAAEASKAMLGNVTKSEAEWGKIVREANGGYSGEYPSLVIFHGEQDYTVDIHNADEIIKQWKNVCGISGLGNTLNPVEDVQQTSYFNSSNVEKIRYYRISDMGHQLAVDPGEGPEQGGKSGIFARDKNFFSSYWSAKFWGLIP